MEMLKNILIKLFGKLFGIFSGLNIWFKGFAVFFLTIFSAPFLAGLVVRILVAIGFGVTGFVAIPKLYDRIGVFIKSSFLSVPYEVQCLFGLAQMDIAINILLGGIMASLALAGMDRLTGSVTAWRVINRPIA